MQGDRHGFGLVDGEHVIDVSDAAAGTGWSTLRQALTVSGPDAIAVAARAAPQRVALTEVAFEPPITDPEKILCVGLNYATHAGETKIDVPEKPSLFVRFPSSQVGHLQPVVKPEISDQFDFEGELAVVIGRRARHVPRDDALDYVAGYTIFGEHSVRDWQMHSRQATPGKNFRKSGAIGPWIVTADEISDPSALQLVTRLTGVEMQNDTVDHLIFAVPDLIAYVSAFTELVPGDVISTGTPAGVGFARKPPIFMKPGDRIEIEISGIGILANPVIEEES